MGTQVHGLHYTILSNGSLKFSTVNHGEKHIKKPIHSSFKLLFYPFWISTFKSHANVLNHFRTLLEALNDTADFYLDISINIY